MKAWVRLLDPDHDRKEEEKTQEIKLIAQGSKLFGGHYSFQRSFALSGWAGASRKNKED